MASSVIACVRSGWDDLELLKESHRLIVNSYKKLVSLPDTFSDLPKLKHLRISGAAEAGFWLPCENTSQSSYLSDLDIFSGAIFLPSSDNMEVQTTKFPNIRRPKCKIFHYVIGVDDNPCKITVPDFLSRQESLDLSPYLVKHPHIGIHLPRNLKKLTLSGLRLPWRKLSTIGEVPNILQGSRSGETWNMEEGQFWELRFLKLASLDIVRWTSLDDQFSSLRKFLLVTLERVEVSNCSRRSVKQIQESQLDLGNSNLEILSISLK